MSSKDDRMRWDFWRRKRRETDLDDEIAYDLAMEAEERVRSGVARQEAEQASRRDFGNVLLLKEGIREMWGWTSIERLAQDLRYGWRTLRKNPLFATMAVLSLALGIGANTAIFSFMDAILMRALPVQRPGELVILNWHTKGPPGVVHGLSGSWYNDRHTGWTSGDFPYPAFESLRANNSVLSSMFGFADAGRLNLSVQGQTDLVDGQLVSGNFFNSLGVRPAVGRLISEDDDRSGAAPTVVISYNYWRRRFAGSADAIGQPVFLNRMAFTIAGVSAPEFFGVDPGDAPDLFIPLHVAPLFSENPQDEAKLRFLDKNFYWVEIMGRLRPGASLRQAQADLAARFQRYVDGTASTKEEKVDEPALALAGGGSGIDSLRREYSKPLYVLMAMVGLILAIACANIANLLLARAAARRREIAVRLSLGAGRLRVIRQLMTESVLLALLGGVLGVWVAALGIRFLTWLLANGRDSFTLRADLSWQVLGFTFALALITGILFGLVPAIQATRIDITPALKQVRASAPRSGLRLNKILVIYQIAISLLLTIAAGLFVRTLSALHSVELGFDRENVLLFRLNAKQAGYSDAALARFYTDLWARFRTIPGVRDVSLSDFALVSGAGGQTGVAIPGRPVQQGREPGTSVLKIGPAFFSTMRIPILLGRELQERDMTGPFQAAVVNEVFAKKYFPNENPTGRHFGFSEGGRKFDDIEIVGVAKAARYNSLKQAIPPVVYIPFSRRVDGISFELRTYGDPLGLVATVRQIVRQADPRVPVSDVNTQSRQIDQTIYRERIFAQLCSCFAGLALLMSCIGLYGMLAYTVARRTGEIGIRMALGADRHGIIRMVVREMIWIGATGLAIGLAAAWGTTRYLESFLFGLKPRDPVAILLATGMLAAALVLACYEPAMRASRIDPLTALRHE
jgi:macrolide transport system ATP-binding/permease protein